MTWWWCDTAVCELVFGSCQKVSLSHRAILIVPSRRSTLWGPRGPSQRPGQARLLTRPVAPTNWVMSGNDVTCASCLMTGPSYYLTSHRLFSCQAISYQALSCHVSSSLLASCQISHIMHVLSCHVMTGFVMSCCVMSSQHVMSWHVFSSLLL